MEYHSRSTGWRTLLENYGFFLLGVVPALMIPGVLFLHSLVSKRPLETYGLAILLAVSGIGLIGYAKWPLYQQRRFFTFGSDAIPESRRPSYRWGYRVVLLAGILLQWVLLA